MVDEFSIDNVLGIISRVGKPMPKSNRVNGMFRTTFYIPANLHELAKLYCTKNNTNLAKLVTKYLESLDQGLMR